MTYHLSTRSKQRLLGVDSDLCVVVKRAIQITPIDFGVLEGVRSKARQRELVDSGASRTMNSRHITGHAVDLLAYVGGELSWHFPHYIKIAAAMRDAANELNVPIRWGGCWKIINDEDDLESAVEEYKARKAAQRRKPFLDGPHFELPREHYPE